MSVVVPGKTRSTSANHRNAAGRILPPRTNGRLLSFMFSPGRRRGASPQRHRRPPEALRLVVPDFFSSDVAHSLEIALQLPVRDSAVEVVFLEGKQLHCQGERPSAVLALARV